MQFSQVLRVVNPVVAIVGLAMIASSFVSLIYYETMWPLLIGGLSAIVFSILLSLLLPPVADRDLGIQEGCAIATFAWLLCCFFGALPFYVMGHFHPGLDTTFTKSFYEAVSGFTTTGSSIFADVEILPKGILFWRSFTHWFGGMGIVVFAVAMLPKLGIGGMQAFRMESSGPMKSDRLVPRISQSARILYTVYLATTIIQVICLKFAGVNMFDSLLYTFGTVGTGGFSNYNNSVAGLNNHTAEYIIAFFMWFSGVSFALSYLAFGRRDWKGFFADTEFRVYTAITVISIASIVLGLHLAYPDMAWADMIRLAAFQVPTVMTTTGYATTDYNLWPVFPLCIMVILLFVGGSTGSTAGGIKVLRHIINFKFMKQELLKIVRPDLVTTVKVGNRPIDEKIVGSVLGLTMIYLTCFFFGGIFLTFYGFDFVTSFTASIANLGNIGPGLGIVGPAGNYSTFPAPAVWMLSFLMLLGRLEIYTVFALFVPWLWLRGKALR